MFSGNGTVDTAIFDSPPNLPWLIEWEAHGAGQNSIVVTLMAPDNGSELLELVSDSGTGQIGGVNLVWGSMGAFYLKVEGPDTGWNVWVRQQ
ncbi:MAG: hypothetical protein O6922_01700 [Chloroflexi bacterium]|nr:hypothetical protein [Chloroflexota bacterium]